MKSNQSGFSLIELLLVVVIIGIVAAMAVPAFQRAKGAAENRSTFATMRTMASTQVGFFSQNNRFARLPELQKLANNGLGTTIDDRIVRGRYVFEMLPAPTDAQLGQGYIITATRSSTDDVVYKFELTQTGKISQILPGPNSDLE
jgi:type IV pilus assembly protein PilE